MDRRIERPHARRSRVISRGGIGLVGALLACILWWLVPASGSLAVRAADLRIDIIRQAPFRDFVPLRAEVVPLSTTIVSAVSGGQVAELVAADGEMVVAQAPLARLANPQLALEVASRSADIAGQLSGVSGQRLAIQRSRQDGERDEAEARNALLKAEEDLRRKRVLFDRGIVTRAAIDPLIAEADYRRRRVAVLQAGRAEAGETLTTQAAGVAATDRELRQSLAMVRASLATLVLRAPVGGRLTAFTLQPGQAVKPGDPVGQIDSEGRWKLVAEVDQFYLGRVRAGLAATVLIDERETRLTVLRVLPQVSEGRFRIELGFVGSAPPALNRGQVVDVRLVLGADRPAVVAPAGGWLDAGGGVAFVLDGERHAVRRSIVTGRRNPDQVEITAGLSPGERIVTSPIAAYATHDTLLLQ